MLVCALLFVLKDPSGLLAPTASLEDGTYLLAYFHENPGISSVWRFYASYVSLGPNLIGYLASLFPLTLQPGLFVASSVTIAAATAALPFWRQLDISGLNGPARLALVFILVLAPVGNSALIFLVMYSLWHMLFFLCLIVLFWVPAGRFSAIVISILGILAISSHPGSIVLLPFMVWRAVTASDPRVRKTMWIFFVMLLAYLALGIDWGSGQGTDISASAAVLTLRVMAERVLFETFFGTFIRMHLVYNDLIPVMWAISGVALALIAGLIVWLLRTDRTRARDISIVLLISLGFAAFSTVTRGGFLDLPFGHRYSYVSCWLLAVAIVIAGSAAIARLPLSKKLSSSVVLVLILIWGGASWGLQSRYYHRADRADEAARLAQFLETAESLIAQNAPYCVILDRDEWSIRLSSAGGTAVRCAVTP